MNISYFGKSDIGRIRKGNEDYFASDQLNSGEYIFVVADGMGGHKAGEVASKLGTLTFVEQYKKFRNNGTSISDAMNQAVKKANKAILKRALADPEKRGMGTTFSAIVFADMNAYIVHVGDSRIYLIRDDTIQRLTKDHTFVEKMVEEGRISEDEARDHPQKNILYMSLGARESFVPEIIDDLIIQEGDIYFLCSDGLNSMVSDHLIKEYSLSYYPEEAADKLIKMANDNGGTDNITIQIIRIGQLENLHKTEPIPVVKRKVNVLPIFLLFLGILLVILLVWILL
jgi:protein phosphatase